MLAIPASDAPNNFALDTISALTMELSSEITTKPQGVTFAVDGFQSTRLRISLQDRNLKIPS